MLHNEPQIRHYNNILPTITYLSRSRDASFLFGNTKKVIGRAGLTPAFTVPQARKRLLSRNFSTPRLKRRLVYFALRPMAPPNRVERLLTGSEPVVQAATPEGYIMAALAGIEPTTTESKSGVLPLHYRAIFGNYISYEYNLHHYH